MRKLANLYTVKIQEYTEETPIFDGISKGLGLERHSKDKLKYGFLHAKELGKRLFRKKHTEYL